MTGQGHFGRVSCLSRLRADPGWEGPCFSGKSGDRVSAYFQDYITVGSFAALGVVLVVVMLGVASLGLNLGECEI